VATLIGADRKEIIFTSGATESNNLAIKGAASMYQKHPACGQKCRGHIITEQHEHKATLDPCKRLQKEGFDVTFLEPRPDGVHTAEHGRSAMRDDTILVTIMWANNEIGTINEIPEIGSALPRPRHRSSTPTRRSGSARCRPTSTPTTSTC
jgi:cysteine desulfurase